MREHPARNYIRFLLTTGEALDKPEDVFELVKGKLNLHSIPAPDEEYIEKQVERLDVPTGFVPGDPTHEQSVSFLRKNRIYGMHFRGTDELAAISILETPSHREPIECLLLGGFSDDDVAYKINKKQLTLFTKKTISLYRHYFFNTLLMDADDWKIYHDSFECAQSNLGEPMSYVEKRTAIISGGRASAAYRTGMDMELDRKDMLGEMLDSLFAMFSEMRSWGITEFKLKNVVKIIRTYDSVYKSLSADNLTDLNEVLRMMRAFCLAGKVHNVKSLAELDALSRSVISEAAVSMPAPLALGPGTVFDVEGSPE